VQAGKEGEVIGDPVADVSTFLDVALLLAPGLSDGAMLPLLKATQLGLALKQPTVQKKAYKTLAYLFTCRPTLLRNSIADAVKLLLDNGSIEAAAKRYRLRCVLPVVVMLSGQDVPDLSEVEVPDSAKAHGDPAQGVVACLVAELVLCTKEVNAKTRSQAYSVLVHVAHALHEANPPQRMMTGAAHLASSPSIVLSCTFHAVSTAASQARRVHPSRSMLLYYIQPARC
jgi:ribosomal RNA-processing protein 12